MEYSMYTKVSVYSVYILPHFNFMLQRRMLDKE